MSDQEEAFLTFEDTFEKGQEVLKKVKEITENPAEGFYICCITLAFIIKTIKPECCDERMCPVTEQAIRELINYYLPRVSISEAKPENPEEEFISVDEDLVPGTTLH